MVLLLHTVGKRICIKEDKSVCLGVKLYSWQHMICMNVDSITLNEDTWFSLVTELSANQIPSWVIYPCLKALSQSDFSLSGLLLVILHVPFSQILTSKTTQTVRKRQKADKKTQEYIYQLLKLLTRHNKAVVYLLTAAFTPKDFNMNSRCKSGYL